MGGLTWLHLSDWHQNGIEFNRRVVRNELINDIRNREDIHPDLSTIDFIIFSGDLANKGKAEEYRKAKEQLLDPLLEACGKCQCPDRLFIVPGNHDLDQDLLDSWQNEVLDSHFLISYDSVRTCLGQEEFRDRILHPFQAFASFVEGYNHQEHPNYGCVRKLNIRGEWIALLGINSALTCGLHKNESRKIDDRGFVFVGEPQVYDKLEEISNGDTEFKIKIAVLHHTFDWLNGTDLEHVRHWLMDRCDFILQGHQHRQDVSIIKGLPGSCTIIPAGASQNWRTPKDLRDSIAYNYVHLDFDSGNLTVFLRRWSESRKKFVEDVDSYEHGIFTSNDRDRPLLQSPGSGTLSIKITASADNRLAGCEYSSIQEAVYAARPGDTITVSAGAFRENIHIDKSLKILGAGASKTFIDGSQAGSVFTIGNDDPNIDVTLSGIAIKEGSGSLVQVNENQPNKYVCGGGILNYGRLNLTDCIIFNNTAFNGGGIFNKRTVNINNGTTVIRNIANNGGGIFNNCGSQDMAEVNLNEGSAVENNIADQDGAGIYSGGYCVGFNTVNINAGCTISGNIAGNNGGGICIFEGTLNMNGGTISNNDGWTGGGIYCYGCSANLNGGSIHSNKSMNGAGVVNASGGLIVLDGTLIYSNIANKNDSGKGGGIQNAGELNLKNGSIDHNIAFTDGGGIWNEVAGTVTGIRTLVHDNKICGTSDNISPEPGGTT